MAINQVPMRPSPSLVELMQQHGSEAQCTQAMATARWPGGYVCPVCHCCLHPTFEQAGRNGWQCRRCRYQTTVTADTIFEASQLPLKPWFLAMHLRPQAKNNVSALEVGHQLGVRWRTARRLKRKLMTVMAARESRRQLSGRVEIDDGYLGSERAGKPGRGGRGSSDKIPLVMAVSTLDNPKPH